MALEESGSITCWDDTTQSTAQSSIRTSNNTLPSKPARVISEKHHRDAIDDWLNLTITARHARDHWYIACCQLRPQGCRTPDGPARPTTARPPGPLVVAGCLD